jgi:GNAT superfamily N-acetyltransferase
VSGGAGLIGYVTLAAGHIEREHLTKSSQRNRPPHVPVILLGQLAVDRRFQGEGHAAQILAYTLRTCLVLSRDIGCFGVITHPVDDAIRAFYARYGFAELPGDPRRAMIVRIADLEANGFGRLGPE